MEDKGLKNEQAAPIREDTVDQKSELVFRRKHDSSNNRKKTFLPEDDARLRGNYRKKHEEKR